MSSVKTKLFEEIFNPKKLEAFVLPQRIVDEFPDGRIENNYLFHGVAGIGKSSLAIFLASKKYNCYVLNASLEGNIDQLRQGSDLYEFCNTSSILGGDLIKAVVLDELNGVSKAFFEGLKGFIDKFKKIGIVFIGTTNYIEDIEPAILSRLKPLAFDLKPDEIKSHKEGFTNRVKLILDKISVTYENEEILDKFINRSYPDFRSVLQDLQFLHRSGKNEISKSVLEKDIYAYNEIYSLILEGNINDIKNVMSVIIKCSNPLNVLKALDRDLLNFIESNHVRLTPLYSDLIICLGKYTDMASRRVDPSIVLKAMVFEMMKKVKVYSGK